MQNLSTLGWIAVIIVVIGGLNWGLIGLLNVDLVAAIFGAMSILSRLIYIIVGLSAIYVLILAVKAKSSTMPQ
jgi:uncharacterized membrane protein YuzA (DUF378 family)